MWTQPDEVTRVETLILSWSLPRFSFCQTSECALFRNPVPEELKPPELSLGDVGLVMTSRAGGEAGRVLEPSKLGGLVHRPP